MSRKIGVLVFVCSSAVWAQDATRNIVFNGWGREEPKAVAGDVVSRPYRRVTPGNTKSAQPFGSKSVSAVGRSDAALGVTVWKLDTPKAADAARLLVLEGAETKAEFTPRRIEAGELLRIGDKVRLSIESPKAGYLYIVDQEMYADGRVGPPYLIFPLAATRDGDNRIHPGQLIDIPEQMDPVNVFTIKAKGPSDRGERLTIFLSPQPVQGLQLTRQEQRLPDATFQAWLGQFQAQSEHLELVGGKGRAWTTAEQQAGADRKRLLTLADPVPQTVFLFPGVGDKPILARVLLRFAQ